MSSPDPNTDRFAELALPVSESLYNFANWLCRDSEQAHELVQETYVKALRGFSSFRQGTNFRAWIFTILRNTFLTTQAGLDRNRTLSLGGEDSDVDLPVVRENPESDLLNRSNSQLIEKAIGELPIPFQEVLLLSDVEGMSYLQISEILCIPMGTVMSRLARARKSIRERLKKDLARD
ncbi:MAG: sigma-70 family RNA polymerase sigma factor [Acidobacteriales bacterium]|nr:sigma-70 family RNA polymerase sigma factor [Terriglobales bacterium]